jgi:hypothetical protein
MAAAKPSMPAGQSPSRTRQGGRVLAATSTATMFTGQEADYLPAGCVGVFTGAEVEKC